MIKATELRRNNWVKIGDIPIQIWGISERVAIPDNGEEDGGQYVKTGLLEPIEITPKLLSKIPNCKKVKGKEGIYSLGNLQLMCNNDGKALLYIRHDDNQYCYVREINYLHQFQNAAFMMSDIELEITL